MTQQIPLTPEMRQTYIELIHKVWPVQFNHYNASHVTDEVADIMDTVLEAITECSKGLEIIKETFESFYLIAMSPNKWRSLIKGMKSVFSEWFEELDKEETYQICVTSTAWKWRSTMEIALMQIPF